MNKCRVVGHRWRFWADGSTMWWACERCGSGDHKEYETAEDAERYARAFDREDTRDLGKRAPLFGLFPLRLARAAARRRERSGDAGSSPPTAK